MNTHATATALLPLLGGKQNIASAAHCATRLRLVLVDDQLVDKSAIEKLDGVKGCFSNAGQIQIIFGTGLVNKVYADFIAVAGISESSKSELTDLAGIAAGMQNSNYFVSTAQGRFVLTLFERIEPAALDFYLRLMAHLAARGLPCPQPLATAAGERWRMLAGKPAALLSCLPGRIEAALEQGVAGAMAAQRRQEVHLAQLAGVAAAARERRDAAAAEYFARGLDDEIGAAWLRVGGVHGRDFGIVDRETGAAGAEFGHDAADDRGERRIICWREWTDDEACTHRRGSRRGGAGCTRYVVVTGSGGNRGRSVRRP